MDATALRTIAPGKAMSLPINPKLARRAVARLFKNHLPQASHKLAQCFCPQKLLTPPPSSLRYTVIIQSPGSGLRIGTYNCRKGQSLAYLLKQLFPRLLGKQGEIFAIHGFCIPASSDTPKDQLFKIMDSNTQISRIAGGKNTVTLEFTTKPASDTERIAFINQALKSSLQNEQLLRILEIIHQIEDLSSRYNTLIKNIDYFLSSPHIEQAIANIQQANTPELKNSLLTILVKKLIKKDDLEKAVEVTKQIDNAYRYKARTLRTIAEEYIQRGELEQAFELTKIMPVRSPHKTKIIKAIVMAKKSRVQEACKLSIRETKVYKVSVTVAT